MKLRLFKILVVSLLFFIILSVFLISFYSYKKSDFVPDLKKISLSADPELYIKNSESKFGDLIDGTEKKIIWANSSKEKTEYSIIYLHGFSASRQETSPLCEIIARRLNANLFLTRLSGHGMGATAMGDVHASDYLNDALEAFEIGRLIGKRVIVIGMSTGGTLALYLGMQSYNEALAFILLSPNLGLHSPVDEILTLPISEKFIPCITGTDFTWTPENPAKKKFWTTVYPSVAIPRMMKLVKYVRDCDLGKISAPLLMVYSKSDNVVSPKLAEKYFRLIGSKIKKSIVIENGNEKEKHILAGKIANAKNTIPVAENIIEFIESLK